MKLLIESFITLNLTKPFESFCQLQREVNKVHSGVYSAHLREAKIHGQLAKHYWWP